VNEPYPPDAPDAEEPEHELLSPDVTRSGQWACVCGWKPPIGTLAHREFDKHLLTVRVS
jgi:hypothetical protein